jgi:hypothetical protein
MLVEVILVLLFVAKLPNEPFYKRIYYVGVWVLIFTQLLSYFIFMM